MIVENGQNSIQQILNQTRKYFNPLVSGPGGFELWRKKTGGRKSRWTVPLNKYSMHKKYTFITTNVIPRTYAKNDHVTRFVLLF